MHGVQTFAESFRGIVCHLSLAFLLGLIAIAAIAWLSRTLAAPLHRLLGGGIVRIALVAAMVGTGIVESFSKHTNDPPRSVAVPLPSITPVDISNGWRVTEMREGCDLSRPLDGSCVIHEPWLVRGGFGDVVRISANGWFFPWRDGFADELSVFSDGEIRPDLRTSFFPRPFDESLAVVPTFNWHQLLGCASNLFWHVSTPSNSIVVAWENAPVNRDANSLTNFQAEFFADGRFVYRYDDHAVDYAPVFPFDWDNDGLENSVDPEPFVAGPDAHGTNAEWYNTICSNIVNSNAYYVVDVVAERGPAPIRFTGDRESCLGNPVIVALCGETNHVPLLMGVEYTVTSTVPFSVSVPVNAIVSSAGTSDGRACSVKWPLTFGIAAASGGGYEVEVLPFDPGGDFSWSAAGGGLNLRGASGCAYTSVSNWIDFVCGEGGNCGCNGCSIDGVYSIEDATFSLPSLWCGCRASEYGGTNELPSTPSVSVSFDKAVVFYEDTYTNAPNDVVAKHSTNTTLTVSAYGGEDGGMLYVSAQNIGKLVRVGGNAIEFPYTAFVPPHGGVSFSIEYEAETHSDSESDIIVTASLLPGNGGGALCDSASTTAVKVLLEAQVPATFTPNCSRHRYGVREIVLCKYFPETMSLSWQCAGGGRIVPGQGGDFTRFICPITNSGCSISVMGADGLSYSPVISVVEPEGFFCRNITAMNFELGENVAGGAGMLLELYITPTNVCFGNIALEEVPTTTGEVGGYFENEEFSAMWAHTRERRAGQWNNIGNDNLFLMEDEAKMGDVLPPMAPDGTLTNEVSFGWRDGAIIWTIPLGWNERGTSGETEPIKTNAVPEHQTFIITPDGTLSVIKAGHYVSRGTNTQIRSGRVQR